MKAGVALTMRHHKVNIASRRRVKRLAAGITIHCQSIVQVVQPDIDSVGSM